MGFGELLRKVNQPVNTKIDYVLKQISNRYSKSLVKAKENIDFIATTNLDEYKKENPDGFYHNKIELLKNEVN